MTVLFEPVETVILVESLAVHAKVGVGAPERRAEQTLLIDFEIRLADPVIAQDKMAASINYVVPVRQIEQLCASERMLLLETLAERIAMRIFKDARAAMVTITIRKPRKLPHCEAVGIRRIFTRREQHNA